MVFDLTKASSELRLFIIVFTICLSCGYYVGVIFINHQTDFSAQGVEENYLGNEQDENAEVLKFKKPLANILTTIHGHILSFSMIFLALGGIIYGLPINRKLKLTLMLEPFFGILITFGGIYLLWSGVLWFKYFVMVSGIILSIVVAIDLILIIYWLRKTAR